MTWQHLGLTQYYLSTIGDHPGLHREYISRYYMFTMHISKFAEPINDSIYLVLDIETTLDQSYPFNN